MKDKIIAVLRNAWDLHAPSILYIVGQLILAWSIVYGLTNQAGTVYGG